MTGHIAHNRKLPSPRKLRKLFAAGLSNGEIGRLYNVAKVNVRMQRKRLGFAPLPPFIYKRREVSA